MVIHILLLNSKQELIQYTYLQVRQLKNYLLQLKIDVVENRNIADRFIGRIGLRLNFSRTIILHKSFANFKMFWIVKRSSGFSKLISESAHPLTLIFDVAFECSKITIIISHNIFQSFSRNVSGWISFYYL